MDNNNRTNSNTPAAPAPASTPSTAPSARPAGRPYRSDRPGGPRPGGPRSGGPRPGGPRPGGPRRSFQRKKVCRFCTDKTRLDYKDLRTLRHFITERGKIVPRRISGTCAKHQRDVSTAVKRARNMALVPYTTITV